MDFRGTVFTGVFLILMADEVITSGSTTGVHHEYHFIETPMTWKDAQSYCRVNYNDLATITNMEEHTLAKGMVGNAGFTWIGLGRSGTPQLVWSDGIGILTVFQFDSVPPGCISMKFTGYWDARDCSDQLRSLCYYYDSNGNEKYFLNNELLSWREAQSYCRQHYIDLVSVKTKEQNTLIHHVANKKTFWLGLFRDDWMWSDGSPSSFRNWFIDEPNNRGGDQNCVVLRKDKNLQWGDKPCNEIHPFICYGQRKAKKIAVKVKVSSGVDPNLPSVSDALLKQFQAQLEETGLSNFKIRWRVQKNGQIFHHEEEEETKNNYFKEKKMVVRMTVHSDVDLSDSMISDDLLNMLDSSLKLQSLSDFTLSWRRDETGLIFQRYVELKEVVETKDANCGEEGPFLTSTQLVKLDYSVNCEVS